MPAEGGPENMMLQTARVVLDITFDNQTQEHPANWNWADLLDMPPLATNPDGEGFVIVEVLG